MRIAIVSGICVPHDAISNAVLQERQAFRESGHEVAIYCQGTTMLDDPGVFPGSDPWLMTHHEGYRNADLAIFHFGTGYELFDALLLEAPGMLRVVRFHNVTPPSLLSGVHRRRAQQGLDQVVICERADHVWCDSRFNAETLVGLGVPEEMTSVLELCVPEIAELRGRELGEVMAPLTILYVGRIVASKGVADLLEAFATSGLGAEGARLVLAGNTSQSSPELIEMLRRHLGDSSDTDVSLFEDPSDEQLDDLYRAAAVLAMPSYHEGFCVPVIEAMARGLRVVASDAGALPETVGDAGELVPAGDVRALADGLRSAADAARAHGHARPDWDRLARYSFAGFSERLAEAVRELEGPSSPAGLDGAEHP